MREGRRSTWARKNIMAENFEIEFEHLDEALQEAFGGFLVERGIDEALCTFTLISPFPWSITRM